MEKKTIFNNDVYGKHIEDEQFIKSGNRVEGHVTILDNNTQEVIEENDNLVLYKGREWLLQRAGNITGPGFPSNWKDLDINWFGVGVNGATPGDILTPLVPVINQENLLQPIVLNPSETAYKNMVFQDDGSDYQLKRIGTKQAVRDIANENRYLILQLQTTIISTDANGPNQSTYYDLNECGLFVGDDDGNAENMSIFARCTFSTIRKDITRELVFIWNIYF